MYVLYLKILNYSYRHSFEINRNASRDIASKYDTNLMGEICLNIYKTHSQKELCYEFDDEAEEIFEAIFDKYNGQFNLKYGK